MESIPRRYSNVPRSIFWIVVLVSVCSILRLSKQSFQRFDDEAMTLEELSMNSPIVKQQQQHQQHQQQNQEQNQEEEEQNQEEQNKEEEQKEQKQHHHHQQQQQQQQKHHHHQQHQQQQQQQQVTSTLPATGIQWQGRNFTKNPVTAEESLYLTLKDKSGLTAAVCHRTLHNKILLDPFFAFVSYYRLLGFDRIFIWYKPEIANLDRFDELQSLPYVTMAMYNGTAVKDGQEVVQDQCMQDPAFGRNYDWIFPIDVDEYLWFVRYESVKYFLLRYEAIDKSYISIGKWMYTMKQGNDALADSGFDFDRYPYTAKAYCYKYPGKLNCPSWLGRCKVLVQPAVHKSIFIHGSTYLANQPGGLHMNPNWAHLKEWSDLMRKQLKRHTRMRYNNNTFYVSKKGQVDTHKTMESHKMNKDGMVPFYFDSTLHPWLTFVAQGCPTNATPASIALELSKVTRQGRRGIMA